MCCCSRRSCSRRRALRRSCGTLACRARGQDARRTRWGPAGYWRWWCGVVLMPRTRIRRIVVCMCGRWLGAVSCALAVLSGAPAAASAKPLAPITGKLSKAGYTVIALASNGPGASVRARAGSFTLRPRADGDAAVAGAERRLRRAGRDRLRPARCARDRGGQGRRTAGQDHRQHRSRLREASPGASRRGGSTRSRWARARKSIPIGAANFGRVRSKPPRVSPPGDLDVDGVPDRLDVDINGNLILNNVDRSTRSRAQAAQTESPVYTTTSLFGGWYGHAVNANAREVTDADIDRSLATNQHLTLGILPGSPELDCGGAPDPNNPQGWIGGLSYCTTRRHRRAASLSAAQVATPSPFPACCDADGNGYGTLVNNSGSPAARHLQPQAQRDLQPDPHRRRADPARHEQRRDHRHAHDPTLRLRDDPGARRPTTTGKGTPRASTTRWTRRPGLEHTATASGWRPAPTVMWR